MKKILAILTIMLAMVSCYDDYLQDFDHDGVYFAWPTDVRTFIVGEGMEIKIGVALGGVRDNTRDRVVNFTIDNSLITPSLLESMKGGENYIKDALQKVTVLKPVPATYYSLSDNSKMVIKAGEHIGYITMKADSLNFLADTLTLSANYAIPLTITSADADTILERKRSTVVGLKYENMLFGNYWHGGKTTIKDASGNTVDTKIYYTNIPMPESKVWKLTTISPNSLTANGYSDITTSKPQMILTLDGDNIVIHSAPGADYEVMPDGTSKFLRSKLLQDRKIALNYKYIDDEGKTFLVQDTLSFRNRIRDGNNEWQDENPEHYK
jgi:hypothetical protein